MDEREWLAERFDEHRTRVRAVAHRLIAAARDGDFDANGI